MVSITRRYGFWTLVIGGVGLIFLLTGVSFGLQSSFKPKSCPAGPTAAKTQSKLWFNDGAWWGILFDDSSEEYHIYRYDRTEDAWSDTGTLVDGRNTSRADVLWEESHLYVVSAGTEASLEEHSARFLRYTYDPSTERYSIDKGFPETIAKGGMEAISVARDSTGKLWATYTQGDELLKVYVTHTLGDDSNWVEPFIPPLRGTTVSSDDVSGIVAFGSQIGLMWGNQNDESGLAGYHFATHTDGDPDDMWRSDNPVLEPSMANDHLNLKADSKGRVFAVTKTRRDRIDRDLDAPYGVLWVRDRQGNWTSHTYSKVREFYTRALLLIDEERRHLYIFGTSPTCWGGKIYYKRTNLNDISFENGRGTLFMQGADGTEIGDATSTKQNLDNLGGDVGPMVVASDITGRYYYNALDPRNQEKMFLDGARITNAGWQ